MLRVFLAVVALVVAITAAAAHPPASQPAPSVTYRDFFVPQPDATVREWVPVDRQVPQPPRRFREYTYTYTAELFDRAPAYSMPAYSAPAYPAPSYSAPAFYAVPTYVPRERGGFGLGVQIGGRRGLRAGLFFD